MPFCILMKLMGSLHLFSSHPRREVMLGDGWFVQNYPGCFTDGGKFKSTWSWPNPIQSTIVHWLSYLVLWQILRNHGGGLDPIFHSKLWFDIKWCWWPHHSISQWRLILNNFYFCLSCWDNLVQGNAFENAVFRPQLQLGYDINFIPTFVSSSPVNVCIQDTIPKHF